MRAKRRKPAIFGPKQRTNEGFLNLNARFQPAKDTQVRISTVGKSVPQSGLSANPALPPWKLTPNSW